jgi:hypothetical protein
MAVVVLHAHALSMGSSPSRCPPWAALPLQAFDHFAGNNSTPTRLVRRLSSSLSLPLSLGFLLFLSTCVSPGGAAGCLCWRWIWQAVEGPSRLLQGGVALPPGYSGGQKKEADGREAAVSPSAIDRRGEPISVCGGALMLICYLRLCMFRRMLFQW